LAPSSGAAQVYQKGMQIEGRELVAIHADAVYLRPSGGNVCRVTMFSQLAAQPAPARTETPEAAPAELATADVPGGIPSEEYDKGIQQVSEKEFNISRSLMNKVLTNQAEIMRSARIQPQKDGVKLLGLRRNSLLRRIGLQNGDVLRAIN